MDEEVLNTSLRRFLKKVGITAQREIEKAVREGIASGKLKGHEALPAKATFNIEGVNLKFTRRGLKRARVSRVQTLFSVFRHRFGGDVRPTRRAYALDIFRIR